MAAPTCAGCSTGRVVHDAAALLAHPCSAAQRPTVPWRQCTARARSLTREQRGKGCVRQSVSERTLRCSAGSSLHPFFARCALLDLALLCFLSLFHKTERSVLLQLAKQRLLLHKTGANPYPTVGIVVGHTEPDISRGCQHLQIC